MRGTSTSKVGELGDVLSQKCFREGVTHRLYPMALRIDHCPSNMEAIGDLIRESTCGGSDACLERVGERLEEGLETKSRNF